MQPVGEYVLEIVDIAERIERDLVDGSCLLAALSQFAHENPAFVTHTEVRARSYWAEYCRREFVWARDYPALIATSHQRVAQRMDRSLIGMTARIAACARVLAAAVLASSREPCCKESLHGCR